MEQIGLSHFGTLTFTLVLTLGSFAIHAQTAPKAVEPWGNNPPTPQVPATAPVSPPQTAQTPPPQEDQSKQNQELQNLLNMMMGKGGANGAIGIGTDGNGSGGSSIDPNERFQAMDQRIGSGVMESCGEPPASAKSAYQTAKAYREKCSFAKRGDNQKIAINDYSTVRMPYMYIFDLNGKCLGKTAVSYGNGAGRSVPQPCNDDGSHLTPPGFHITAIHKGAAYGPSNSLGLIGLERQGSKGRGVVVHPAEAPGTASSWGCSGVGYAAFRAVQKSLGEGSLVYNYFGNTSGPNSCRNKNGLNPAHNVCQLDAGAPSIPGYSTSQGAPTLR